MPTAVSANLKAFRFPQDLARMGPPPPNAKSFFVGDQNGGAGWEVDVGDGQVVRYYADLPGDIGEVSLHLQGVPTDHLGGKLNDDRLATVCDAYFQYLDKLLRDAKSRFRGGV